MYADRDLDYGRRLLPYFAEFLQALYAQGLSKKTFGQYRDSLSLLGSSIIRNVGLFARLCRRIEKYLKKNPPTTRRTTPQDPS